MKKYLIIILCLISFSSWAKGGRGGGPVHVHGYTKSNGTYVQPHYRTSPDGIKTNNWSYRGNVNPYTGRVGTTGDGYYRNYGHGGVILPQNVPTQPGGNHYIYNGHELHNTKTASDYVN